jgi:L-fuculose-phosphate aldolase
MRHCESCATSAWGGVHRSEDRQRRRRPVESELRRQICRAGRSMYERGLVVACEGNLSVRVDPEHILVTPTGVCKGQLAPRDLLVTDLNGIVTRGSGRPSSELLMHLLFYRRRPDVYAVCHAHPPTATGFAVAGRALDEAVLPEVVVNLGTIPLASYGTPGTYELCESLEPLVATHDAILLQNHGVVTCGQDLTSAYQRLETIEQFAQILLTAHSLGGPRVLSNLNVQKLVAARSFYGVSCPGDSLGLLTSESLASGNTGPFSRPCAIRELPEGAPTERHSLPSFQRLIP